MRRHRHNLKPGQPEKLEAYFDQFPERDPEEIAHEELQHSLLGLAL